MLKREYFVEQMEMIFRMLCLMLFNKNLDDFKYDEYKFLGDAAVLKNELELLINNKKICEAKNLLFYKIEDSSKNHNVLQVALWFYLKLNEFDEDYLKKQNFSKNEILEGLEEIEGFAGKQFG